MSSTEICAILREQILKHYPEATVISLPVADGGEGTVDCFLQATPGTKEIITVKNPLFEDMQSFYGLIDEGRTAIIEMAASAGLPLIEDRKDPVNATTFGVGQLIIAAANRGVEKIIIGLGGSATNDGGCGAACAVGVRFYDSAGKSFMPTGGTLRDISRIDISGRDKALDGVEIIAMCDIDNPMYGPSGAAYVFGPQKGATPEIVGQLDKGLHHLSDCIKQYIGEDYSQTPGAGAAGAMGAGMMAFFGAKLQMGIESVLDTLRFDDILTDTDLVITGEGKIDEQSLRGKVVIGVARRAKRKSVPVIALVGAIGDGIEAAYDEGVSAIFCINRNAEDFVEAHSRAKSNLALAADNLMRFLKYTFSEKH